MEEDDENITGFFDPKSYVESLRSTLEYYRHREETDGDITKSMYHNLISMLELDMQSLKRGLEPVV